ncbi:MAG TPA: molybdopterin dinucleotide binding domain-containing protein, partial [Blastocatellia bacterium]|nr:molybdopterin dinucleotide binding domain-containing protein [Blastocatellia bacterium]
IRRGMVTLPHGYGMEHTTGGGNRRRTGARINELTSAEDRDPIAGTPYHKYVPVRLTPLEAAQN